MQKSACAVDSKPIYIAEPEFRSKACFGLFPRVVNKWVIFVVDQEVLVGFYSSGKWSFQQNILKKRLLLVISCCTTKEESWKISPEYPKKSL